VDGRVKRGDDGAGCKLPVITRLDRVIHAFLATPFIHK
jgi:hypothetical protein